jgi:hypothetical protein
MSKPIDFNQRGREVEQLVSESLVQFFRACQAWDASRSHDDLMAMGRAGSRVYNAAIAAQRLRERAVRAGLAVMTFQRDGSAEVLTWRRSQRGESEGDDSACLRPETAQPGQRARPGTD